MTLRERVAIAICGFDEESWHKALDENARHVRRSSADAALAVVADWLESEHGAGVVIMTLEMDGTPGPRMTANALAARLRGEAK